MKMKRSDFLLNISHEFIRERDFNLLISKVLETVKQDFGLTNCALLLYNKEKDELFDKSFIGFRKKDARGVRIPLGKGITGKCAKRKRTIYVPDVSKEPAYIKVFSPSKSELAIPLVSEKELLGVLNFEKSKKNGFDNEEIITLKTFSSIVSIALENTLLFEDIKRKEKQKLELIEIARTASETMKKENVFGKLTSLGGKLVDADMCTICMYNKKTGEAIAQLPGYGVKEKHLKQFHFCIGEKSIWRSLIKPGVSFMTNDVEKNPNIMKSFIKLFGVKRLIVSPLKTSKEVIGLFYAAKNEGSEPFTDDDKDILLIFSSLAATIIKRMQIYNELRGKKKQFEDLTNELKRTNEELLNISFAKTNLISNISHELRTPLVSIEGYTDLLFAEKLGDLNDRQKLSLLSVKRNVERLINSIDNLIDMSRLELGIPRKVEKQLVNITSVLNESLELVLPKTEKKNIKVKRNYESEFLIVEADKEKLLRVFLNIIDNAVKFNKKNGKIFVKCYKSKGNVLTEIKDTGNGIPEKFHRLIFNRFFQVESSDRRGHKGAGIGLSLSFEIIKFFDGDIRVRSKPKKGSTFIVTIPAK